MADNTHATDPWATPGHLAPNAAGQLGTPPPGQWAAIEARMAKRKRRRALWLWLWLGALVGGASITAWYLAGRAGAAKPSLSATTSSSSQIGLKEGGKKVGKAVDQPDTHPETAEKGRADKAKSPVVGTDLQVGDAISRPKTEVRGTSNKDEISSLSKRQPKDNAPLPDAPGPTPALPMGGGRKGIAFKSTSRRMNKGAHQKSLSTYQQSKYKNKAASSPSPPRRKGRGGAGRLAITADSAQAKTTQQATATLINPPSLPVGKRGLSVGQGGAGLQPVRPDSAQATPTPTDTATKIVVADTVHTTDTTAKKAPKPKQEWFAGLYGLFGVERLALPQAGVASPYRVSRASDAAGTQVQLGRLFTPLPIAAPKLSVQIAGNVAYVRSTLSAKTVAPAEPGYTYQATGDSLTATTAPQQYIAQTRQAWQAGVTGMFAYRFSVVEVSAGAGVWATRDETRYNGNASTRYALTVQPQAGLAVALSPRLSLAGWARYAAGTYTPLPATAGRSRAILYGLGVRWAW